MQKMMNGEAPENDLRTVYSLYWFIMWEVHEIGINDFIRSINTRAIFDADKLVSQIMEDNEW